jgi:hypothetical protein
MPIGQWTRLVRRDGADTALGGTGGKILIGGLFGDWHNRPAHPHLPALALPMKAKRCFGGLGQLLAFGTFEIGEENKPRLSHLFQQYNTDIRHAVSVHGRQRHCVGIIRFGFARRRHPLFEQGYRVSHVWNQGFSRRVGQIIRRAG